MRPLNVVLLVAAGAIGGAFIMKVAQRPHPAPQAIAAIDSTQSAAAQSAPQVAAAPAPQAQPAVMPATPAETATAPELVAPPEPAPLPSPFPEKRRTARSETHKPGAARTHPQNNEPLSVADNIAPQPMAEPQAPPQDALQPEPAPMPASQPAVLAMPQPAANPMPAPEQPANMAQVPPPAPPAPNKVTLNSGMLIPVRLVDGLSTDRNVAGDAFSASLDQPLVAGGFVIAERGARVEGRVVAVDRGTKMKGRASLAVELNTIHTSDGQSVAIRTDSFEKHGASTGNKSAEKVAGGAVIGAVIGAIAGGGKGAAIGGGVGAGAGAGDAALTGGEVVKLPSETRISFRLSAPVTITEQRRL